MSDQTHDHVISSLSLSSIFSCQFQCETGADASYLFSRIESKKYQFPFIFPPSSFPLSRHVPSNAAALNQHCREGKNHSQLPNEQDTQFILLLYVLLPFRRLSIIFGKSRQEYSTVGRVCHSLATVKTELSWLGGSHSS